MHQKIESMNFKELRDEVQRLRDEIAVLKRTFEDLLYNLDEDNFSGVYRKKTQTLESTIEQAAGRIKAVVTKQLNFGDAIRGSVAPDNNIYADTEKLYYWDAWGANEEEKGYYYFNDISDQWEKVSTESIYSAFVQTPDGFEFNADVVKINGNLITDGTISGDKLSAKSISGDKIQGGTITGTNIERRDDAGLGVYTSLQYGGLRVEDTTNGTTMEITPDGFTVFDGNNSTPRTAVFPGVLQLNDYSGSTKLQILAGGANTEFDLGGSWAYFFNVGRDDITGEPAVYVNDNLLATHNWVLNVINQGTYLG